LNFDGLLLTGGMLLAAGVVGGAIARWLHLPKLTGYLAAGIVMGHHVLDLLPEARINSISPPINDLAMALVLFVLGGQFHFRRIREQLKPVLALSAMESTITFTLVTLLTWPVLDHLPGAILLGIMAIAVAPATTVEVLREYRSEGLVSDSIRLLTALSNVWAVLIFEIALLALFALNGADTSPWEILWDVGGSLLFGIMAGHALILMQERIGQGNYSVALLTTLLLTIGACQLTGVPHMLAMLVTGAVVVNRSRYFQPIVDSMENFAQPAYVAFFVLGGIHLNFTVLVDHWLAASLYILARVIGKVVGARVGLRMLENPPAGLTGHAGPPIGLALLCQAGAAIALATLAGSYDPALGETLLSIVLGAVVVFELIGPLLVRHVVIAAAEVRMSQLLTHATSGEERQHWLSTVLRASRGRNLIAQNQTLHDLQVDQVMRRAVKSLPDHAQLDEVLRFANHSPFNHFPVINDQGCLLGTLSLQELQEVTYDRRLASLVIARDLISGDVQSSALEASCNLADAVKFFQQHPANTAAVVDNYHNGMLVGMIERAEVLGLVRKIQRTSP
jgi:Kef-type K+ transport system membrane component KefB/predicted transcriptional regulator